jgi:hydroxyacylglutathione hydrolase
LPGNRFIDSRIGFLEFVESSGFVELTRTEKIKPNKPDTLHELNTRQRGKDMPVHLIRAGYANTYLIEDDESLVALDVGTASAARAIYHHLSERALDAHSLRMVTSTHFHIDHVGGISRIVRLFPKARVCFATTVEAYLKGEEKLALFPLTRWIRGLLPVVTAYDNHLKGTVAALLSDKVAVPLPLLRTLPTPNYPAECILDEGQEIPYLPHWELIKTPGHTPDSICLYHRDEGILISGDTILNMRGTGELNNFCSDCNAIKRSFKRLSTLKIRAIYPGHGEPLCDLTDLESIIQ